MDERRELAELPEWVSEYLACWGSKLPDGGRMTVTFAAEFAGISPDAVRKCRQRNPAFTRLEDIARHAGSEWAQTYIESGIRAMAPWIMASLAKLVKDGNPQAVLKVADWMRGKPTELQLSGSKDQPLQVMFGWDDGDDGGDGASPEAA